MSTPPPASSPSNYRTLAWGGFVAMLLSCIAAVMVHSYLVDTVTHRLCEAADQGIPVEKRMPVFLDGIAMDGYLWNRHAEVLGKDGSWRLRDTDFDNAPDGRKVYWNSAFAWYLRGLGEIYRSVTHEPLRHSIFRMSIWANPILLVIALAVFATAAARRFGPLCGSVIAFAMVGIGSFYEGFMPAYPDHHGIIAFACLGTLFGIAWAGAGWVQSSDGTDFASPRSLKQARQGMILSAMCGAAGLWISTISTAIILGTIGFGVLVAVFFFGRESVGLKSDEKSKLTFHPELWKTWSVWGAVASLIFFVLEFFPSEMSMHLEINHPLHSLAWFGGGCIIVSVSRWFIQPDAKRGPFPWRPLVLPAIGCCIAPAMILLGDARVYSPKDAFYWQLLKNIVECMPITSLVEIRNLSWQQAIGWMPLLVIATGVLLCFRSVGRGTRALLVCMPIPIIVLIGLQFYQIRWGTVSGPLYIALAAIFIPQLWRSMQRNRLAQVAAVGLIGGFTYLTSFDALRFRFMPIYEQYSGGTNLSLNSDQAMALLHRQMARSILDSAGDTPVVLLSSPNSSCMLSAFGGFRTIGTLYWENIEGLKAAAAGLNSQSDDETLAFVKKHGVTHISMMTWENFIEPYFHILYPKPVPGITFENSFGKRALNDKAIPIWSQPLPFVVPPFCAGLNQTVLMLRVAQGQSLNEAKFHIAQYALVVQGRAQEAETIFKDILKDAPDSNVVRIELSKIYFAQDKFREAVDEVSAAVKSVAPEVRESILKGLADQLAAKGRNDLAGEVMNLIKKP